MLIFAKPPIFTAVSVPGIGMEPKKSSLYLVDSGCWVTSSSKVVDCRDEFEVPEKKDTEAPSAEDVKTNKEKWSYDG